MPDVVVIGGGVMGCAIALRLAQAGVKTVVLERAVPGAEASSAAAGILAAQEDAEAPGPLADLCLRSRGLFAGVADELRSATGVDIGYRPAGVLRACVSDADEAAVEDRYAWQRRAGMRLRWVRGDDLREVEAGLSPRIRAGLHFPDDGQVEPRAYLRALSLAAAAAGASFRTGGYVRRVLAAAGRVAGVEVEGEAVPAGAVVVAAGSWSSLVDGAGVGPRAVRPMRGQILKVETRPPGVRGTITAPGGYVVGRADGSILLGSTMELVGFDKRITAGGMRHVLDLALGLVPQLAEAPVVDSWANFRPVTDDKLPIIGAASPSGLYLATGHFRNGILLSPVTAAIVRDLIVTGRSEIDLLPFSAARLS